MWNITPDDIDRVKEELKGRRDAIQARYDAEVEKLTAELDDIEAFERVATAFAQRHKQEKASASVEPDPIAPLEALPIVTDLAGEANDTESSDLRLDNHSEMEILPGGEATPIATDASVVQKASSLAHACLSRISPEPLRTTASAKR